MKISKSEYEEFVKHYTWEYMKTPYYRVGQAFINYFPSVYRNTLDNGNSEQMDTTELWTDPDEKVWKYIQRFVQE